MKGLYRLAVAGAVCMITAACSSGPVVPALGSDASSLASRGCAHFSRHQYEVCYAYLVNDSLLARVPYYQVGRQPVLGPPVLARLKSRYYGPARHFLIDQTKGWPRHVDVSVPSIRIAGSISVSANLATATIHTVETWLVRSEPRAGSNSGRVLFAETNARHTVSLQRTPTILCLVGDCLHKWVVVRIR
jgi:hypothetical protein